MDMSKPNGDIIRVIGDTGHRIWIDHKKETPSYHYKVEGKQQQVIDEETYNKTRQLLESKGKPLC